MLPKFSTSTQYSELARAPGDDDRREHRRQPMDGTVMVIPTGDPLERFWATSTNISRGGMFVHTVMNLPLHAEVSAKIHLEGGSVVRAQARVVREEDGRGYGCSFTGFSAGSVYGLTRWLCA